MAEEDLVSKSVLKEDADGMARVWKLRESISVALSTKGRSWLAQRGLIRDDDTPALSWEPLPTTEAAHQGLGKGRRHRHPRPRRV